MTSHMKLDEKARFYYLTSRRKTAKQQAAEQGCSRRTARPMLEHIAAHNLLPKPEDLPHDQ